MPLCFACVWPHRVRMEVPPHGVVLHALQPPHAQALHMPRLQLCDVGGQLPPQSARLVVVCPSVYWQYAERV